MGNLGSGSGSSYPTSLDTQSSVEVNDPNAGRTKARAEVPNDLASAVIAVETTLGTSPAGTAADVKTYLQVEHNLDGTHKLINTFSISQTPAADTVVVSDANGFVSQWIPPGIMWPYGGSTAPTGWLLCDGAAISRSTYAPLFAIVGTSFGVGNGSTTFNVPNTARRALVGAGGTGTAFTVTVASPAVFTSNSHGLIAGWPVSFETTGALPTGLTAGTVYYVISAGLTANAFEVSATVGGAAINTSGTQSGSHTWFRTIGSGVGRTGGAETHTLVTNELASHTHGAGVLSGYIAGAAEVLAGCATGTSDSTGGSLAHNNMQPSLVVNWIIKT